MARHPKARQKGDGKIEDESRNMAREGDKTEFKDLVTEDKIKKDIVQHPHQNEVETTASAVTEQFKAHHLAERWVEEVDDRGQGAFNPRFYVADD